MNKAKTACQVSGHEPADHFVDVNKTIQMPKTAEKEVCASGCNRAARNAGLLRTGRSAKVALCCG